jgi:hypothetical protein
MENPTVEFTISAQKSRAFSLMSSRKKIRQAPGRLLRQKLVNLLGSRSSGTVPLNSPRLLIRLRVCRKSGNCAFKQPETLDTALDSLRRKKNHTHGHKC